MSVKIYGPGWLMELPDCINPSPQPPGDGDLQDGMLSYYLSQAGQCDANVDHRLDREPFDFRDLMKNLPENQ